MNPPPLDSILTYRFVPVLSQREPNDLCEQSSGGAGDGAKTPETNHQRKWGQSLLASTHTVANASSWASVDVFHVIDARQRRGPRRTIRIEEVEQKPCLCLILACEKLGFGISEKGLRPCLGKLRQPSVHCASIGEGVKASSRGHNVE